jgi:DNA repair exonuclease SbcCD ATPase subunit
MENNQTERMVAWLDEERRKDKALIAKLEERSSTQAALLEEQARRIHSLDGELAAMRGTQLTIGTFDESMGRLRSEFLDALEQTRARREKVDEDLKRLREMDRDALTKALEAHQQDVINRLERELQPRKAEVERFSRVAQDLQTFADNLSKRLEDFERTLSFLEEQRRQDTRRISDINSELLELAKRMEEQVAKSTLLEELSRRNERAVEELSGTLLELKQERKQWMEQSALAEHQREQVMNDMVRRIDAFGEQMAGYGKQVEGWADTHRTMKKYIDDFERQTDRVERRLNEVTELQRLSEDRFRQEWEEFLQEDQKRWRQFTLNNEEAWRINEKQTDDMLAQLARLGERGERLVQHVQTLTKAQQETLRSLSGALQTIREQSDDGINELPSLT